MAEALTRKQVIQAVWNKFKAIIGNKDISGIGDGTVTGALVGLNGNMKMKVKQGLGCEVYYNDAIVIIYIAATGIHQESGALSSFIALPEDVALIRNEIYITTDVLNAYWIPAGISAYIGFSKGVRNATINFTNSQAAISEVIVGPHVFPRSFFDITE